jgi:hypothetical protein
MEEDVLIIVFFANADLSFLSINELIDNIPPLIPRLIMLKLYFLETFP